MTIFLLSSKFRLQSLKKRHCHQRWVRQGTEGRTQRRTQGRTQGRTKGCIPVLKTVIILPCSRPWHWCKLQIGHYTGIASCNARVQCPIFLINHPKNRAQTSNQKARVTKWPSGQFCQKYGNPEFEDSWRPGHDVMRQRIESLSTMNLEINSTQTMSDYGTLYSELIFSCIGCIPQPIQWRRQKQQSTIYENLSWRRETCIRQVDCCCCPSLMACKDRGERGNYKLSNPVTF